MAGFRRNCTLLLTIFSHQLSLTVSAGTVRAEMFNKFFSDGQETVMITASNCRSLLSCVIKCAVSDECTGFHYNYSFLTCELYSGPVFGTINSASGKVIYRKDAPCLLSGFQSVQAHGQSLCLGYFSSKKTFEDAKLHCESMTSRLLHVDLDDSVPKLNAIASLLSPADLPVWISQGDRTAEGMMDTGSGEVVGATPSGASQTSDSGSGQDCMWVRASGVNYAPCSFLSSYICEI